MIIDKTKEEAGRGYQILRVESTKNYTLSNFAQYKTPRERFKILVLVIGDIIFWVIFVWYFLFSFYQGY